MDFGKYTAFAAPEVKADEFVRHLKYESTEQNRPTFDMFCEALHLLSSSERSQLLKFITGCSRLCNSDQQILVQPLESATSSYLKDDIDSSLPVAQTCADTINIPNYSSTSVLLK